MCKIARISLFGRHSWWAGDRNGSGRFLVVFARLFHTNNWSLLEGAVKFINVDILTRDQV